MSFKLFLSYTREKNLWNAVHAFRDHLQSELRRKTGDKDLLVFLDTDLRAGDKWEERLLGELDKADCLVILLSPLWLKSSFCVKEYTHFIQNGTAERHVVPVLWDDVDPSRLTTEQQAMLGELNKIQKADWTQLQYDKWDEAEPQKALAKLAKEIDGLL